MDEGGRKWHFDNPGTIERIGTNGIMHHLPDVPVGETALLAQSCNLTGISGHPDERHLFLPEQRAEDSGYLRLAGPPSPPTCKHWLFKLRALHYHFAFNNPGAGEDEYARYVRKEFDCDDKELIETMVLMENIIIDRRALAHRSSKNLYLAKDGLTGEQVSPALEPDETAVLRTFAEQSQKFSSLGEEVRHTILKLNFQ
jgi:hypothetical protein